MKAVNIEQPYLKKFDHPLLNQKRNYTSFSTLEYLVISIKKKKKDKFSSF